MVLLDFAELINKLKIWKGDSMPICCEHSMLKHSHDRKGNELYTTYVCVGCGFKEQIHDFTLGGLIR